MKTIKGKIEFFVIEFNVKSIIVEGFNEKLLDDRMKEVEKSSTNEKNIDIFKLSEMKEEQFVDFVDSIPHRESDYDLFENYIIHSFSFGSAKESFFSLLKANGIETKEMRKNFVHVKARAGRSIDVVKEMSYPEDLLIIKLNIPNSNKE